jgi:hypothetical protein
MSETEQVKLLTRDEWVQRFAQLKSIGDAESRSIIRRFAEGTHTTSDITIKFVAVQGEMSPRNQFVSSVPFVSADKAIGYLDMHRANAHVRFIGVGFEFAFPNTGDIR